MSDIIGSLPKDTVIVSGGAPGADSMAEGLAKSHGLETKVWYADWTSEGRAAGLRRNTKIVGDIQRLIAFMGPEGCTPGTMDTVHKALAAKIPVAVLFQREK